MLPHLALLLLAAGTARALEVSGAGGGRAGARSRRPPAPPEGFVCPELPLRRSSAEVPVPARRRSFLPRPPANNGAAPAERGGGGGRTEAEREVGGSRASLPPGCPRPPLPSGFSRGRCASPGVPPPLVGEGKLCRPGGGRGASGGGRRSGVRGRHRARPVAHHTRRCAGRRRGASRRGWRSSSRAAGTWGGGGVPSRAVRSRGAGFPAAGRAGAARRRSARRWRRCSAAEGRRHANGGRPGRGRHRPLLLLPRCPVLPAQQPARRHPPVGRGRVGSSRPPGLSAEGSRCRPVKVCGEPTAPSLFCPTEPAGLAPGAQPGPRAWSSARSRPESRGTRLFLGTCLSLCPMLLFQARAGKH